MQALLQPAPCLSAEKRRHPHPAEDFNSPSPLSCPTPFPLTRLGPVHPFPYRIGRPGSHRPRGRFSLSAEKQANSVPPLACIRLLQQQSRGVSSHPAPADSSGAAAQPCRSRKLRLRGLACTTPNRGGVITLRALPTPRPRRESAECSYFRRPRWREASGSCRRSALHSCLCFPAGSVGRATASASGVRQ